MIIFLEGLPRSGKSYSAMVQYIIPALQKGRKVYAYIEGLNHQRIAEAAELSLEVVESLLYPITREQVPTIYEHVENDALVAIDELANFWPSGRRELPEKVMIFIKEHGHRGLDLLCMDQVMTDSHKMWTGRVDTLVKFRKLDAIGKEDQFSCSVFKRDSGGKFKEVTKAKPEKYDPKYFGTYKSHTEGTLNTANFADARANVKNSKAWKVAKIYSVVALVAIGFIIWFFNGGATVAKEPPKKANIAETVAERDHAAALKAPGQQPDKMSPAPASAPAAPSAPPAFKDHIEKLQEKHRARLTGIIWNAKGLQGWIEWRDESNRLYEVFTLDQMKLFGYFVTVSPDGQMAVLTKPGVQIVATQWPLVDDRATMPERMPEKRVDELRPVEKVALR